MDLGTAVVGAAIIMACVVPFVFLSRSKKKAEKQLLDALTATAATHHCTIVRQEVFGDFAIGLDEDKHSLFFYKKSKDEATSQYIDLAKIKTCKVANTNTSFNNKNGAYRVIDKLELCLVPIAANKPEIALEFYDVHKNIQLNGELQSIEKWANLVNERLKRVG